MLLDEIGFHAGSFAPAFSGRKVYPVYRLHFKCALNFGEAQLKEPTGELLSGERGCETHKRTENRKKTFALNLRQTMGNDGQ
jgi:hypothetical protein